MQRTLGLLAGACIGVLLAGCGNGTVIGSGAPATPTPFPPGVTNEYAIPTGASNPGGIITGPDGALWFTEINASRIGRLSQAAVVTDYAIPAANTLPQSITVGPDGQLWFTESARPVVGRLNATTLAYTEVTLPNAAARPWGIVPASNGSLWVSDPGTNAIWQITPLGVVSQYPITTANAKPTSITIGPDSAIYYTEANVDRVGRLLPSAAAGTSGTEYPVSAGAGLGTIVSGNDNALWFTESSAKKIGRMLTNGTVTAQTPLPGVGDPIGMVLAADGNFYIGDYTGSQVVRFVPSTLAVTLFPTKSMNSKPYQFTLGPDKEVYFTEQGSNSIGQFRYF